jgi:tetratricopeptide (TPR) repeat protein
MKRLRYILLFFLSFLLQHAIAQDPGEIEKLKLDLKNSTADTDRVNALSQLCFNYSDANFDSAQIYGNKALQLSADIHYATGVAQAYTELGWSFFHHGDNEKAKQYLDTGLEKFTAIGNIKYYAAPLSHLATIYMDEKNYSKALTSFEKALQYSEQSNNEGGKGIILYNIGEVYNAEGDHKQAREYFIQARDIQLKVHDEIQAATAISSIANTYQFEEKFDSALIYYHQLLPIFLKHNDLYRLGIVSENIGVAYENKKQYPQALQSMQEAKKYYTQINSKSDLAFLEEEMGEVYLSSNNTPQALSNFNDAIKLADQIPLLDLKRASLLDLSNAYKQTGDYKDAYLFMDSSYKIKDSLFTKEKQSELAKIQTQFETEQKEKENQLLRTENTANAIELKQNKKFLAAALAGLILLIAFLFALYKNGRTKIKNIQKLRELNTQLHQQKEEIMRINTLLELKALRVQMNPHFIFNCMSSIQECILTGRIDDANTYLTKFSRLLRMVLNYADDENILLEKELEILNLYLQLEKIRLKGSFEYAINVDEELLAEELKVPTLLLQPFAENAIWHGLLNKPDNRMLTISGSIKNDTLLFTVEDNGVGRAKAAELRSHQNPYKSKAIELVKKRLQILQQQSGLQQTGFEIFDLYNNVREPVGTKVEIILPIINS